MSISIKGRGKVIYNYNGRFYNNGKGRFYLDEATNCFLVSKGRDAAFICGYNAFQGRVRNFHLLVMFIWVVYVIIIVGDVYMSVMMGQYN